MRIALVLGSLLADGERRRGHPAAPDRGAAGARPRGPGVFGHATRSPTASPTGPRCTGRPSVPFFLYPDVQWAFPRLRDVVEDLARFRPDVVHVATEFSLGIAGLKAARQLGIPMIASAHTDYEVYAARYGVPWAVRAGWHYLRWFYGQAHRVLCPSRIYEEHLHSRGVLHTGIWSRGVDPGCFHPRFRSEAYRARFGVGPGDLLVTYIGRLAREKNLELLLGAWERLAPCGAARSSCWWGGAAGGADPPERDPGGPRARPAAGRASSPPRTPRPTSSPSRRPPRPSATRCSRRWAPACPRSWRRRGRPRVRRARPERLAGGARTASRRSRKGSGGCWTDAALRRRLAEGALRTARERNWDEVYDRLLEDYADAVRGGRRLTRAAVRPAACLTRLARTR